MNAKKAKVEVLSDEAGHFYARAFNRDGLALPPGRVEIGKDLVISTKSRMGKPLVLRVEDYIPKGRLREVFTPRMASAKRLAAGSLAFQAVLLLM